MSNSDRVVVWTLTVVTGLVSMLAGFSALVALVMAVSRLCVEGTLPSMDSVMWYVGTIIVHKATGRVYGALRRTLR